MKDLAFDWDQWNIQKNEIKHGISRLEAESAFFDKEAAIFSDARHSTAKEKRWILYGKSIYHNVLMVAFTVRAGKIRIISARKAARKERETYEESKS
jgi:uncharacterized DUF497 family protein